MKQLDYHQSNRDHTMFFKHLSNSQVTILLVYVDDIIMTGSDSKEIRHLEHRLAQEFAVKSLEQLKYFLGIEVAHSKDGIFLSQQKYVLDLLEAT